MTRSFEGPAPLRGLRLLDLTRLLPGPYATLVLADLGADVVKVEDPELGDYCRVLPPLVGEGSALFHLLNRNKRSIALDLKRAEGRETFFRLLERFDVVIESFRPGVMERLGIGYEALRERQPRAILCSISGYGQDGPYRLRAGHDVDYQALGGLLGASAEPAPTSQIADIGGGAWPAALGLLAAAWERERTGRGRRVEVSMAEGCLAFLAPAMGGWQADGQELPVLSGAFPCYRIYRTSDGRRLALGALEPKFWTAFCEAVGRVEWIARQWEEGAVAEVEALFRTRPAREWLERLAPADCCCEPVLEGEELFGHPLHVERGAFFEVDGLGTKLRHARTPVHFDGHEIARGSPPRLGEHTAAVLGEGGLAPAEIQELERRGAIRCPTLT